MLRWQVDPYRRAARPEERKPRGRLTFAFRAEKSHCSHDRYHGQGAGARRRGRVGVWGRCCQYCCHLSCGHPAAKPYGGRLRQRSPPPVQRVPKCAIVTAFANNPDPAHSENWIVHSQAHHGIEQTIFCWVAGASTVTKIGGQLETVTSYRPGGMEAA